MTQTENRDETHLHYSVDVPPSYPRRGSFEEWINIDYFETHEEALKFAQENFGADDNGMVCLISKF